MESVEAKDGFSFRPQREKRQTMLQPLSPPRQWRQQQQPKQHTKRRTQHLRHNAGAETGKYPLLEYTDFVQVQMEAEDHFNKSFTFTPSPAWKLPPTHTMFSAPIWQEKELQGMKAALNTVKQQLSTQDVAVWHTHTTNTNPSQRVCHTLKRRVQPELPTQAWLKFYEIVNAYPIVPSEEDEEGEVEGISGGDGGSPAKGRLNTSLDDEGSAVFNSVHLCEAPGAFIAALNHYLALNQPSLKWQWLGSTLNPYYEGTPPAQCVTHDRLIYHTLENWCFGTDNTGDLMKQSNVRNLLLRAERLGPIKLVTADGSFDCQADPAEQERMTHPLHMCEAAVALSILAAGGSLVLKKFTLFESETICLMYFLCCVFECVHVYKPATSKQGNSEVYVVGLKYIGRERITEHLEKIISAALSENPPGKAMFQEADLPEDFMKQVKECSSQFMAYQTESIKRNLELFRAMPEREKQLNELLKAKATALFFERNYCAPIPKWRTLTQGLANQTRPFLETDWNKVSSSLLMRSQTYASKFGVLGKFLNKFDEDYTDDKKTLVDGMDLCVSSFIPQDLSELKLEVVRGKPFQCIESSKFCSEMILRVTRELYILWESKQAAHINTLQLDDSFATSVLTLHPEAILIKGEDTLGLHPGCQALEEVIRMLEDGDEMQRLPIGGSVAIVGAPLLSRLQYGLLLILASAFTQVKVYRNVKVRENLPVLVLEGLKSEEAALEVVQLVRGLGSTGGGQGLNKEILQVLAMSSLLQERPLTSLHHYNVHLCAYLAQGVQKCITAASSQVEEM